MRLKVNYGELNNLGDKVVNKATDLEKELSEMLLIVEKIGTVWNGVDARNFVSNASAYVKNSKITVQELDSLGNLMKEIAGKYCEQDIKFEKDIKTEGLNDTN